MTIIELLKPFCSKFRMAVGLQQEVTPGFSFRQALADPTPRVFDYQQTKANNYTMLWLCCQLRLTNTWCLSFLLSAAIHYTVH